MEDKVIKVTYYDKKKRVQEHTVPLRAKVLLRFVKKGLFTDNKEVLKVTTNDNGTTIAHEQVRKGWITEDKEILRLSDRYGWTVAHEQALHGWVTEDKEILKLEDVCKWTVAHEQAKRGWVTEDVEILKLADNSKWTVAHMLVCYHLDWYTTDIDILTLVTNNNLTVLHLLITFREKEFIEEKLVPVILDNLELLELKSSWSDYPSIFECLLKKGIELPEDIVMVFSIKNPL